MRAPEARRRRPYAIGIAAAVASLCSSAGVAFADGGGITPPDPPQPRDLACVQQCPPGDHVAVAGSTLQVTGVALGSVTEVTYASSGGRIAAPAKVLSDRAVQAKVPDSAIDGPVGVSGTGGSVRVPGDELRVLPASSVPTGGSFTLDSARATPKSAFYDGTRAPKLTYSFRGGSTTDVVITVVNRETEEVVDSFVDQAAEPNAASVATWDGTTSEGTTAPNGEYQFRIGNGASAKAKSTRNATFSFHKFRFPLAVKHGYGDGYGAGRGHEGQDVFAKCGSKLLAVRGGRVQMNDVQSEAGNYLVIDGKGTRMDFMYAHMLRPSPLREGQRVRTGQVIGQVGQTGNAQGCHLHFELWSAPGYYEGGQAMPSVGTFLKTLDSWS
jgi:murein DD-endopeptidase MepM/ murein hydrolase activator NlpD